MGWLEIKPWPFTKGYAWYDEVGKRSKAREGTWVAALAEARMSKVSGLVWWYVQTVGIAVDVGTPGTVLGAFLVRRNME